MGKLLWSRESEPRRGSEIVGFGMICGFRGAGILLYTKSRDDWWDLFEGIQFILLCHCKNIHFLSGGQLTYTLSCIFLVSISPPLTHRMGLAHYIPINQPENYLPVHPCTTRTSKPKPVNDRHCDQCQANNPIVNSLLKKEWFSKFQQTNGFIYQKTWMIKKNMDISKILDDWESFHSGIF